MSRLPPSALEEGDQIHAILRPLLAEAGAAKRRATGMAAKADPRSFAFGELDQAIDALLLRMRVDPRPTRTKTRDGPKPSTRDVRPVHDEAPQPPELPAREALRTEEPPPLREAKTGEVKRPLTRPTQRPVTREADRPRPMPDLPPPVPTGKGREPPEPPRPSFDENPPPVPTTSATSTRNLQRPTPITTTAPPVPRRTALPVHSADAATGPIVLARPGNAPETFLLYDDIVMLSAMNDRDGLMISLERLLVLARLEDHVRVFIDANEQKLVGLYEAQLKSFSRAPQRRAPAVDNTMPRAFLRGEKVAAVLQHIDGKATITDIVQRTALSRIETLSVIAQLQRAGIVDV